MAHYLIRNMVSKKTCAPQFYRGWFEGVAVPPGFINIEWGSARAHLNSQGNHGVSPFFFDVRRGKVKNIDP